MRPQSTLLIVAIAASLMCLVTFLTFTRAVGQYRQREQVRTASLIRCNQESAEPYLNGCSNQSG